jgi:hypothetical protein
MQKERRSGRGAVVLALARRSGNTVQVTFFLPNLQRRLPRLATLTVHAPCWTNAPL